jgi:aldose 1-epimerase
MNLQSETFGFLPDGRETLLFTLQNDKNITIKITNYGGIITSIETPGKNGVVENIAWGFDKLELYLSEEYLKSYPFFGCLIGRFGNRIANGHLEIEGLTYQLAINNGPNHLHGGLIGYDKVLWNAEPFQNENEVGLKLTYFSPDMEENYPGNLKVTCIYSLNNDNELGMEYFAETDKTTVVNLTNHSYFNLNAGKETILNHELMISATKMTEMVDQIPTGKIVPVENTPYDFTSFKKINRDFASLAIGYDDNFVFDNETGEMKFAGCVQEAVSGRKMEVYTTQPGMQLYTGHWIPEITIGDVKKFGQYSALALETQHFPDSVHHDNFPSTLLKPGEKYNEKTVYKFGNI